MSDKDLQHPVITALERTGYPDGKVPEYPHCPVCGNECETIYRNKDFETVGCDECLTAYDAWERDECFS